MHLNLIIHAMLIKIQRHGPTETHLQMGKRSLLIQLEANVLDGND